MSVRALAAAAAAATALLASAVLTAAPATADDNLSVTVKDVTAQVSRTGGITVSGTMNCAAAVQRAGGVPDDTNVMVNMQWTAWQAVGRNKMVTASWTGGGHANPCYESWGSGDPAARYLPWNTSYYNSSSTPYYVFPSTGKFGKGPVHVDVQVLGGPDTDGPDPNVYPVDPSTGNIIGEPVGSVQVFAVTGFDLKAR